MAITTYTELQTAVDNWLARTDLAGRSPEFIALAEARMSRELETQSQEKRVVSTMTAGDAYVTLPPDARQIRSVRLNTNPISVLQFQSPTAVDDNFPGTGTGKPRYYSVVGGELYFRPAPDDSYQAEILYVGSVSALSDTNTSNTKHEANTNTAKTKHIKHKPPNKHNHKTKPNTENTNTEERKR